MRDFGGVCRLGGAGLESAADHVHLDGAGCHGAHKGAGGEEGAGATEERHGVQVRVLERVWLVRWVVVLAGEIATRFFSDLAFIPISRGHTTQHTGYVHSTLEAITVIPEHTRTNMSTSILSSHRGVMWYPTFVRRHDRRGCRQLATQFSGDSGEQDKGEVE
jgi:hypothetical protein